MTAHPLLDLSALDQFAKAPFPPSYPPNRRTFFSPVDDVHGALVAVLQSATRSIVMSMFGFDDQQLADIIRTKLLDDSVYCQLTFDSTQAGGVHERAILTGENYPASSVAVGRSERGAIIHLKMAVVDGTVLVKGSTNWSASGESLQDNELTVEINAVECALATTRIGAIHADCLQQMARKAASAATSSQG